MTGSKPLVAIVGRPNVGKSTLFNRLAGRRAAVVSDVPGTTRDRVSLETVLGHRQVILVDTGGLEGGPDMPLAAQVTAQVEVAIQEADVIIFLTDALEGVTPADEDIAQRLRRAGKPILLVANKADNDQRAQGAAEFYRLGLGDPLAVSAYHARGVDELEAALLAIIPEGAPESNGAQDRLALAIIGRVNVGKSSLLNAILGHDRAIVSETPGTTRDAIDTPFAYKGQEVLLIDTAGIRRPGKIARGIEKYAVLRALQAIDRSDVVLLVLDATELPTAQDAHLAGRVANAFKGMVLVVNKWDLAPTLGMDQPRAVQALRQQLKFMAYAPVRFASALRGTGIEEVLDAALMVHQERRKSVSREQLASAVMDALAENPPPSRAGRSLRVTRTVQEGVSPPTFTLHVNDPTLVHFSYYRYLENRLRESLGFRWNRLKLVFQGRKVA
ncbi:MAG: ribosome biogenesis GTPase Der [Chloroflexi bacterium]|nr:ribosome biogenesis GTPase Der [Chloroflexota bacterium]